MCLVALVAASAPVFAADSPDGGDTVPTIPIPEPSVEATPPVEAPAPTRIEEIIVTATKREESLRDIPASISAFDGSTLETQGKMDLNDYVQETPGIVANLSMPGVMRMNVRGIQTDTDPLSPAPSPVGIFIGDTPFLDPYLVNITPDLSAFDLRSVEILKGPQGTLFGGAALSGAIRYVLEEPAFGEWHVRGFSQYANAHDGGDAFTSGVAVNVPILPDDLALRAAYIKRKYPGVYDDARTGEHDVDHGGGEQVRAALSWAPLSEAKIKLTHLDQDYFAPNDAKIADERDGPRQTDQRVLPWTNRHRFALDSLDASYDFHAARVVSVSSSVRKKWHFSGDYTAPLYGTANVPEATYVFEDFADDSRNFSQELRIQSTDEAPFRWLAGAYYFTHRLDFNLLLDTVLNQQLTGSDPELSLLYAENRAKAKEHALFFDLGYRPWEALDLSAGARLYRTSVSGGFVGTGVLARAANLGMTIDQRDRIEEDGINPKLAATLHFTDDLSAYVSASRGYRFGGIQQIPPSAEVPATYKSDSLWNYEVGLRTSWLDDTLQADLTAFYIRYKDPQIVQQQPTTKLKYYTNVSAAISRGLEVSVLWYTPLDGLHVRLAGGVTDAHITEPFTAVGGVVVEPGTQMPGAARNQGSASVDYRLPLASMEWGGHLGYVYTGRGYGDIVHSQRINGFGTFDAGLFVTGDAWGLRPQLSLSVANLLDTTAAVGGSSVPTVLGAPYTSYTLNPPRTLSLRVSVDFF